MTHVTILSLLRKWLNLPMLSWDLLQTTDLVDHWMLTPVPRVLMPPSYLMPLVLLLTVAIMVSSGGLVYVVVIVYSYPVIDKGNVTKTTPSGCKAKCSVACYPLYLLLLFSPPPPPPPPPSLSSSSSSLLLQLPPQWRQ